MTTQLTYRQAARRVRRSIKTIKRWRRNGMPMTWDGARRVVNEDTLLAWWRDRLQADPAHQYRLRRQENTTMSTPLPADPRNDAIARLFPSHQLAQPAPTGDPR